MVECKGLYREAICKLLKGNGIEPDTVDVSALWDSTLTYDENKTIIEEFVQKDLKAKKDLYPSKKEADEIESHQHKLEIEEYEKSIREEENKAIERIKEGENLALLDKYFEKPKEYIKAVANGNINALVLISEGGLGKSHLVFSTLSKLGTLEEKFELGVDYEYVNTYTTSLGLYNTLYANRDRVLILDDIEGLLEKNEGVSLLKSALWSPTGYRTVSWNSTTTKRDAPARFEFKGQIILCLNKMPKNANVQALLSRAIVQEINFSYDDKIKMMYEIAKTPYKDIDEKERIEVMDFIKANSDDTVEDINFRTLIKGFELYRYSKDKWKDLTKEILSVNPDIRTLKDVMKDKNMVKEQIRSFCELTGHSRATFFRWKK